jgi:hypothetical protein
MNPQHSKNIIIKREGKKKKTNLWEFFDWEIQIIFI